MTALRLGRLQTSGSIGTDFAGEIERPAVTSPTSEPSAEAAGAGQPTVPTEPRRDD